MVFTAKVNYSIPVNYRNSSVILNDYSKITSRLQKRKVHMYVFTNADQFRDLHFLPTFGSVDQLKTIYDTAEIPDEGM